MQRSYQTMTNELKNRSGIFNKQRIASVSTGGRRTNPVTKKKEKKINSGSEKKNKEERVIIMWHGEVLEVELSW